MDINDVYKLIEYIILKEQSAYLSPEEFNRNISMAQRNYMSFMLGSVQRYTPGRPVANVEFGQNQVIRQRLAPVIYGYELSVDAQGHSPYPGDYLQTDAIWDIYGARVRYVQQDSRYSYLKSVIDPVTGNPCYLIEDTGFRFMPTTIAQAHLSYVRNPPNMVWGYAANVYGVPTYDPGSSVQPVWDDLVIMEIIARCLQMSGVSLQSAAINNYAQEIKLGGQ